MPKVFVKERKARPFWFGHPWVFSGAIDRVKGQVRDGDVVELCDHEGHVIGQGFWNGKSQIQVRLTALAHEGALDEQVLLERLDRALSLRRDILRLSEVTNAMRLVHAEGDGIPGFIVDQVGTHLAIQVSCLGLVPFVDRLLDRLVEVVEPQSVVERESRVAIEEEGLRRDTGLLRGSAPEGPVEVHEHGVTYYCDILEGQKTGWYADQRDNRLSLAPLARGLDVLDAFAYTGGFGLRMALEGAAHVHLIDSSQPALELAQQGAIKNQVAERVTADRANVLRALDRFAREGRRFDLVVVDPPKLVHRRANLGQGLRLYHEINAKAVNVLRRGGILITCSCSQHVLEHHFEEMLGSVAKESRLRFQEVFRGKQASDHPVMLPLEESRYLKCRALRVHA